jgi:hypothetical protein
VTVTLLTTKFMFHTMYIEGKGLNGRDFGAINILQGSLVNNFSIYDKPYVCISYKTVSFSKITISEKILSLFRSPLNG